MRTKTCVYNLALLSLLLLGASAAPSQAQSSIVITDVTLVNKADMHFGSGPSVTYIATYKIVYLLPPHDGSSWWDHVEVLAARFRAAGALARKLRLVFARARLAR